MVTTISQAASASAREQRFVFGRKRRGLDLVCHQ